MRTHIVLTLTGTDRPGIVEDLTKLLLNYGGNVETSRMARLGGEFAVLMLVSMPEEQMANLDKGIRGLKNQGFKVTTTRTGQGGKEEDDGRRPFKIEVLGADHEGIIHEVAQILSRCNINIEAMDTSTTQAPNSGAPLFSMTAFVVVPSGLSGKDWAASLDEAGRQMHVDIKISAAVP